MIQSRPTVFDWVSTSQKLWGGTVSFNTDGTANVGVSKLSDNAFKLSVDNSISGYTDNLPVATIAVGNYPSPYGVSRNSPEVFGIGLSDSLNYYMRFDDNNTPIPNS